MSVGLYGPFDPYERQARRDATVASAIAAFAIAATLSFAHVQEVDEAIAKHAATYSASSTELTKFESSLARLVQTARVEVDSTHGALDDAVREPLVRAVDAAEELLALPDPADVDFDSLTDARTEAERTKDRVVEAERAHRTLVNAHLAHRVNMYEMMLQEAIVETQGVLDKLPPAPENMQYALEVELDNARGVRFEDVALNSESAREFVERASETIATLESSVAAVHPS